MVRQPQPHIKPNQTKPLQLHILDAAPRFTGLCVQRLQQQINCIDTYKYVPVLLFNGQPLNKKDKLIKLKHANDMVKDLNEVQLSVSSHLIT